MILVPYLRRKSDLLTAWNFFLVGAINFVGLAALKAAYSSHEFRILAYERRDYELYIIGAITFFVTLTLAYYWLKFPRKLAGRLFRKWPPVSTSVLYVMIAMSLGMAVLPLLPIRIPGVSQVIYHLGNKGIVVAVAMAFAAWFKEKNNPVLLGTLLGVLLFSAVLAVMAGGGRRTLLSVGTTIPICAYWFWLRYKGPWTNLALFGSAAVFGILLLAAYSAVRHFDRRGEMKERSMANSFEALRELPSKLFSSNVEGLMGQNAAQTSLAAIHLYTNNLDPEPFHSVVFVSTNFIPRAMWEEKPMGLGYTLPKSARVHGTRATWGPGIVGHGFHEGGLHMLVFYGILAGVALRFLDELLVRQSTNPYLLAMFSAMSAHIIGWTRGDIGTFTIQIVSCLIAIQFFAIVAKLVFGVGVIYPRTDGAQFVNQNLFSATLKGSE
ncbi:MAG: hypothetical protein WD851_19720 [Pirellulales bacterium]